MNPMYRSLRIGLLACLLVHTTAVPVQAADPALQGKLGPKIATIVEWGKNPQLADAVKAYNDKPSSAANAMTQATWESLTVIDPKMKDFTDSPAGQFLKKNRQPWVAEAFVSGANGTKAGLLSKTSSWSHAGKAKHDDPMAGKTWQGAVEFDESSGKETVQVGVPVMSGGAVVGSLVVGIDTSKL